MTTPYGSPVPSALPEAPLSINFKVPEIPGSPMLTVRGSNGTELSGLSEDVARHGVQIGKALTDFRSGFLAGAGLPDALPSAPSAPAPQQTYQPQNPTAGYSQPQQYSAPAQTHQQYGTPPQTGATGPAPMCPHGARNFKPAGVNRQGRPYQAFWACPAPQSDKSQCKPERA